MIRNLSPFEMIGGFAAHNSATLMAVPAVATAINCSRKSRTDLSSRILSAVHKIKASASSEMVQEEEEEEERDYSDTAYVPVYVTIPNCKSSSLIDDLRMLKSMNVDGVKIECWWGLVEPQVPKYYDWSAYKKIFQTVRSCGLKLQVVLCFHASGEGHIMNIPLPRWVTEAGKTDPDIFFTRRVVDAGVPWSTGETKMRDRDCLTWGIDDEPVLYNRTACQVYRDFMISFWEEHEELVVDGVISKIEIGLGPRGELRFPSHNDHRGGFLFGRRKHFPSHTDVATRGREYPPIHEFQCYDKYLVRSLNKAWKQRGGSSSSPSTPRQTNHYYEGMHECTSFYGQFFLKWYSSVVVHHADNLLSLANSIFPDYCNIAARIPEICHLWYDSPIISILNKYKTSLISTCAELRSIGCGEDFPEGLADEIGIVGWQVLHAAWGAGIPVSGENDLPCYDKRGYQQILDIAKPMNDPMGRRLSSFTYVWLDHNFHAKNNPNHFRRFVQKMHGKSTT